MEVAFGVEHERARYRQLSEIAVLHMRMIINMIHHLMSSEGRCCSRMGNKHEMLSAWDLCFTYTNWASIAFRQDFWNGSYPTHIKF